MDKDVKQGAVVVKSCKEKDGVLVARYYAPRDFTRNVVSRWRKKCGFKIAIMAAQLAALFIFVVASGLATALFAGWLTGGALVLAFLLSLIMAADDEVRVRVADATVEFPCSGIGDIDGNALAEAMNNNYGELMSELLVDLCQLQGSARCSEDVVAAGKSEVADSLTMLSDIVSKDIRELQADEGLPAEDLAALNNIGSIRSAIATMGGARNKAEEKP